ncbi:MAG: hypothetical protein KC503_23275 [Myxococcales bacterium]|nr:hypothetical protein [Myxococcales bacterium]
MGERGPDKNAAKQPLIGGGGGGGLAAHLERARRDAFVGRSDEQRWFETLLASEQPVVGWLYGPGGIGKSSLLRRWADLARERGCTAVTLDLQQVRASPSEIIAWLCTALESIDEEALARRLAAGPRVVLLVDTWELGGACEGWMRQALLPSLPPQTLVLFAGRHAPSGAWRDDDGWRALLRVLPLRNLTRSESSELLARAGVPEALHEMLCALTHGHPFALTLTAELARGRAQSSEPLRFDQAPDVLRTLMDRFVTSVPSEQHRRALRIAAVARHSTEALLRAMTAPSAEAAASETPRECFEWLRRLPFVLEGPRGLYPHDLARDVIGAEFRWRDPEGFRKLIHQLTFCLLDLMRDLEGTAQEEAFLELLYLNRINPKLHDFFDFEGLGSGWADRPRPDGADRDAVHALVSEAFGAAARPALDYWLERQRGSFSVLRSPLGEPVALSGHLVLAGISAEDRRADPVMCALADDIEARGGLLADQHIVVTRYLVGQGADGDKRLRHNRQQMRYLSVPNLAFAYVLHPHAEPWLAAHAHADFTRASALEAHLAVLEAAPRGAFARDFRTSSAEAWLELLVERSLMSASDDYGASSSASAVLALSREEFAGAVHQALRDYSRPTELAKNALLAARCVVLAAGGAQRADTLRELIDSALQSFGDHPRDHGYARAVRATYIDGARTQEAAAERLSMAFSTYRRHLARGVERVTEWLWQRELGAT